MKIFDLGEVYGVTLVVDVVAGRELQQLVVLAIKRGPGAERERRDGLDHSITGVASTQFDYLGHGGVRD